MMKIKEIIIVEGKNDAFRIKQAVEADVIITQGLAMDKSVMKTIEEVSKTRGIIIFTDPDSPGDKIRNAITALVPQAKQAYLLTKQAKGERRGKLKVGIEHATIEDIQQALSNISVNELTSESLSYSDYVELGLYRSKALRDLCAEHLHLGQANAKTFFKRINMAGYTKQDLERIIDGKKTNSEC